jgi:SAM-dependent methyltransferase
MNIYSGFADYYDRLTDNVPYEKWADYYERIFRKYRKKPHMILDLACGTGSLSKLLAERGYEVIGVDGSEEMLSYALEKTDGMKNQPVFIAQPLERLDLYGTAEAAVCSLDSLNYITSPASLKRVFSKLYNFLEPGGLFVFDLNTEARFLAHANETFIREDEDFYCVWKASYSQNTRVCRYDIDIFEGPDDEEKYTLLREIHKERYYPESEIRDLLAETGYSLLGVFGELKLTSPGEGEQRIFYVSERK